MIEDFNREKFSDILEKIDLHGFEESLSEIHALFKSDKYDQAELFDLFQLILQVTRAGLSQNFSDLMELIMLFRFPIIYHGNCSDYRHEAFKYLYDVVLSYNQRSLVLMENVFPDFLEMLKNFQSHVMTYYNVFSHMIAKIHGTKIMKIHYSLIETTFKTLLDNFYELPYDLDGSATNVDVYNVLSEIALYMGFFQDKAPNLPELIKAAYYDFPDISYYSSDNLLCLVGLMEGKKLADFQYQFLEQLLDKSLDILSKIVQKEELFNPFTLLLEMLEQNHPDRTKEIIKKEFSHFASNLSSLKKHFPHIWQEYEDNEN